MKLRDVDGQPVPRVVKPLDAAQENPKKNSIAPDIGATNATKTGIVRASS